MEILEVLSQIWTDIGSIFTLPNSYWILFFFIALATYIYTAICWQKIAEKLNHPYPWTSWFANPVLLIQLADVPWWLLFFVWIPILNVIFLIIFLIIILIKILEKLGKPSWWVIWFLIPVVNFIILGILAFDDYSVSDYVEGDFDSDFEPDRNKLQPTLPDEPTTPIGIGQKTPGFGVLIVERGTNKGQSYKLAPNSITVIGRAGNIQLPVTDKSASREHARIRDENGKFVLYDLGSMNKTYINSQKVDRKVLMDGDVIRTGQTTFRFQWFRK